MQEESNKEVKNISNDLNSDLRNYIQQERDERVIEFTKFKREQEVARKQMSSQIVDTLMKQFKKLNIIAEQPEGEEGDQANENEGKKPVMKSMNQKGMNK